MSKKNMILRIGISILFNLILTCIGIIVIVLGARVAFNYTRNMIVNESERMSSTDIHCYKFNVNRASKVGSLARDFKKHGIIANTSMFKTEAKSENLELNIVPGTYIINSTMSHSDIIKLLTTDYEADGKTITISISAGATIEQVANIISSTTKTISSKQFLTALNDYDYSSSFGFLKDIPDGEFKYKLEGYIPAGEYTFRTDASAQEVVIAMLDRMNTILYNTHANDDKGNYSIHQILTIASLINKETATDEEKANIAGVIANRVNSGMKLELESTIQYCKPKRDMLDIDAINVESPYNTYLNAGLPIGPIGCPDSASVKAALNPAVHDYFYYIPDSYDASVFHYTTTFEEFKHLKEDNLKIGYLNFLE